MTREKLVAYHDSYAKAMEKYGLQRGIDGSEARHITTRQYYRDLVQQTATLLTSKPVEYSGELYSKELKQKFMAEDVKAKVFSDNGKFILTINLRPIDEWFKEQFEKLKQMMYRPVQPQRQDKGIPL